MTAAIEAHCLGRRFRDPVAGGGLAEAGEAAA